MDHAATPLAQKLWIAPLFGTRKLEGFVENVGSLNVQLTQEDLAENEAANVKIEGARYPDEHMRRVGL